MVKSEKSSRPFIVAFVLVFLVMTITAVPLFMLPDAEFGGADGEAEEAILEIQPDYEPWLTPVFKPQSGEIESLLFALQAALGAGVLGYGLGYLKGRAGKEEKADYVEYR